MGAQCRRKQAQIPRDALLLNSTEALVLPAVVFTTHAKNGQAGKCIGALSPAGLLLRVRHAHMQHPCDLPQLLRLQSPRAKQIVYANDVIYGDYLVNLVTHRPTRQAYKALLLGRIFQEFNSSLEDQPKTSPKDRP